MIGLKTLHEICTRLHLSCVWRMSKLLSMRRFRIERGVITSNTKAAGICLCRILQIMLPLAETPILKECLLSRAEESALESFISNRDIALLESLLNVIIRPMNVARCFESWLVVPKSAILTVSRLIHRDVFSILDTDLLKFLIQNILLLGISRKLCFLEFCLSC
jgi:hypothetical protein